MAKAPKSSALSPAELNQAIARESQEFEKAYRWLEQHMPPSFLDEICPEERILVARNLLSFKLQDHYSPIHLKDRAIILCSDTPDADLNILKKFAQHPIRYYRAFVSNAILPGNSHKLRIALAIFREPTQDAEEKLDPKRKAEVQSLVKSRNPNLSDEEIEELLHDLTPRFLRSMTNERLTMALDMFFRAKTRDLCQYEIKKNEDWKSKEAPSLQIVMAWKNVPKSGFLYRLAQTAAAHNLALRKLVATYIDPYSTESILILSLGLHGMKGSAAWEEADIDDFLREMVLLKYFDTGDPVCTTFVKSHLLTGNEAHLVRNLISFSHQALVHGDPNLYSYDHVVEGFCRHPELTTLLCKIFYHKFHPHHHNQQKFEEDKKQFTDLIDKLDTGQAVNDLRRKNILKQGLNFIDHTLKTNFYRNNKSAFAFRVDPKYLDQVPYKREEKFPEIPYGIFFIRGMHFIGFNIRFVDLARGGVRTVTPERMEQFYTERNNIFSEAYNLAYTQQKKNKDIPEGGAKTAILLEPFEVFSSEEKMYEAEMESEGVEPSIREEKLKIYRRDHKLAYLYSSQRSFIESFMTLINCDDHGKLRAKDILDYWKRPEYIYLGPDENMLNDMLVWIVNYSIESHYKPGRAFMSSSPKTGINHKEYGVTSFGVNVYLHQALLYIGIDPEKDPFTVKISGGPDGDVAGNEIHILATHYSKTAKLLALTDVSGTIFDPEGLDWKEMDRLFKEGLPIRNYPPEKLHDTGFLLDLKTKREQSAFAQQTLCYRKKGSKLVEEWLSGNEMNHLYRTNVHQTKTDAFVPGGGRPRTLNENNYQTFLDETGKPTSKVIVEGANLYLTPGARRALEKLGVIVLKDSSCNKGGVTCSSLEVLSSLCMSEKDFLHEKTEYVKQVLEIIRQAALNEAQLILSTHRQTNQYFTDISEKVSEKINHFKYELLDYLETIDLPTDPDHPLIRCLLRYCPPLLTQKYRKAILAMPEIHKKAIIACYIGSHLVYQRGLDWNPNIADILPIISNDPHLTG
ncbi:MAG: NAD-glutamate dehydrogenase [Verrucomicrobia bacterium]|nr:NAD-glutamate dehydrogenase [Verrucomicrobiota bacterium]